MYLRPVTINKVELKPVSPELITAIIEWAKKPHLRDYFRAWPALQDWNSATTISQRLEWGYGIYENDVLVGLVQLCYPNQAARCIEYGMLIDSNKSKNRYETSLEVERLISKYIFETLNYNKIYVRILESRKNLFQRLKNQGYELEGTLKCSARIDGQYVNELLLAKFRE